MLHWKLKLVYVVAVAVVLSLVAGWGSFAFGWIWD